MSNQASESRRFTDSLFPATTQLNAMFKNMAHQLDEKEPEKVMHLINSGQAVISRVKHIIDCSSTPFCPKGWSIHEEDQLPSRFRGKLEWDPTKLVLHLDDRQENGRDISGIELRDRLAQLNPSLLPAQVLDYLLEHRELISGEQKSKAIFFWGSIYRDLDSTLAVRYLTHDNPTRTYHSGFFWLGGVWHDHDSALRLIR